jgi:hypothetical protein
MKPEIMDALVQTINEAINTKVKALKDDLVSSIANEQRRHLIQLSKTAVKSEVVDLGKELRCVIDDYIKNLPKPENGKDGEDAPAPTAEQIAEAVTAWMVANFTQPKDGKDGTSVTVDEVKEMTEGWLSQNIKQPLDGKNGTSVSIDEVKALSEQWLSANIQQPTNGKDGIDGISVSIDEVKRMAEGWLSQNIQQPKDGDHGKDGRDSAEIEVLPSIDEEKSYPKGTWASYKGGLIKSTRTTSAIGEKSLMEAGWDVIVQGVQSVEVHPLADGEFAVKTILTGGKDHITKFAVPVMVYKGIWKEGAYAKGNTVTTGGSLWHCNKDTTDKPGTSEAWQLCAKKGTDGRDGKDLHVVKMNKPEFYKLDK